MLFIIILLDFHLVDTEQAVPRRASGGVVGQTGAFGALEIKLKNLAGVSRITLSFINGNWNGINYQPAAFRDRLLLCRSVRMFHLMCCRCLRLSSFQAFVLFNTSELLRAWQAKSAITGLFPKRAEHNVFIITRPGYIIIHGGRAATS